MDKSSWVSYGSINVIHDDAREGAHERSGLRSEFDSLRSERSVPLLPPPKPTNQAAPKWFERMETWLTNHGMRYTILLVYVFANIILFLYGISVTAGRFTDFRMYVSPVARGSGEMLNLNCALVVLLMCRGLFAKLQGTAFHLIMPIDTSIWAHKFVASVTCVASIVHGCTQAITYILVWPAMLTGGVFGLLQVGITGLLISVLLVIIFVTSRSCVRRRSRFELFWFSHHLFILFYGLLLLHGLQYGVPMFWMYFVGPGVLYFCDRAYRMFASIRHGGLCRIVSARSLPGQVLRLELVKPTPFSFEPGMYAELACAALSRYEWHPFTIASAPSDPTLVFYVKCAGNWTSAMYELLGKGLPVESSLLIALRGPFGSPTEHSYQFEHVTFVAAGIGATPFVSVLRDVAFHMQSSVDTASERFVSEQTEQAIVQSIINQEIQAGRSEVLDVGNASWREDLHSHSPPCVSDISNVYTSHRSVKSGYTIGADNDLHRSLTGRVASRSALLSRVSHLSRASERSSFSAAPAPVQRLALFVRALLHSLLVQMPVMWVFLIHSSLLLVSYSFLRPFLGFIPVGVYNARLALNVIATVPVVVGFAADVYVQGPSAFFGSWANWLEVALLLPGLVGTLVIELAFYEYARAGLLLIISSFVVAFGFLVRFYVTIGSRLDFTPFKAADRSRLKMVHFVWVNRDMQGLEWLVDELRKLEAQDNKGLFNIQLYLTQTNRLTFPLGLRNTPLQGRPDWPNLFLQQARNTPQGTVMGVFFCGPPAMGRAVRLGAATATAASLELSADYSTLIARTRFLFRMEAF
eukprot:TRINITY_DN747_c0_g1_i1.p1 TRINITY_DN747_c0_g1~~TRINITY_DN747_c0_g1_i1.p1  ORF type:complete len:808 (-),score=69.39 TRINITY_DN747_c0_g1_i1:455-2878(-)